MNSRTILAVVAAAIVFAVVLVFARKRYAEMSSALPPREEFGTLAEANAAATKAALAIGGVVVPIAGTGSMAPYIPAGKSRTLAEQKREIVAYAVTDPSRGFVDLRKGDLVIYRPDWTGRSPVIHQSEFYDHGGWIMSGLHNASSEASERMTADKFVGVVAYTATLRP